MNEVLRVPAQGSSCAACRQYFGASSPSHPAQAARAHLPHSMEASVGVLRPGSLFAQRYRILDQVGEGGFGVIYKAEDLDQHRRLVAIKQINLSATQPKTDDRGDGFL